MGVPPDRVWRGLRQARSGRSNPVLTAGPVIPGLAARVGSVCHIAAERLFRSRLVFLDVCPGCSRAGKRSLVPRNGRRKALEKVWGRHAEPAVKGASGISMIEVRLPTDLAPAPCDDLIRLGRDNDGGYLVSRGDVLAANCLVGLGLNDEWSFEQGFSRIRAAVRPEAGPSPCQQQRPGHVRRPAFGDREDVFCLGRCCEGTCVQGTGWRVTAQPAACPGSAEKAKCAGLSHPFCRRPALTG